MADPLIVPCDAPQAWNVGPLPVAEDTAASVAQTFPESRAHVYGPNDHTVRFVTGKTDPAVIIYRGGEVVAVLWPEQVMEIVRFWGRS